MCSKTMFEETFHADDGGRITESFSRFESDDIDALMGKRVKGKGKIEGYTQAKGELHPAFVQTDEDEQIAAHELPYMDWDGRHNDLPF